MVGTAAIAGDLRKDDRTRAENEMNPDTERSGHICEAFTPVYEGTFQFF